MNNKKTTYFILGTLMAVALILAVVILALKKKEDLEVYFLNVGQGDSILISSGSHQTLIDSGRNGKVTLEKLGQAMPFWDRKIEAVIITHPDADHYGGFDEIFDFYKIENVIKNEAAVEGEGWSSLISEIKNKKIAELVPNWGTEIIFPSGAKLTILYPFFYNPIKKDKNDTSIVARLVYGENEFLFTGDLSQAGEDLLASSNVDIQSDFLKVGHHGSKSSSGDNFLDKVRPREAIISVGKNNYGHPNQEVLDKFKNRAIQIRRTDEEGIILYRCKNIGEICKVVR